MHALPSPVLVSIRSSDAVRNLKRSLGQLMTPAAACAWIWPMAYGVFISLAKLRQDHLIHPCRAPLEGQRGQLADERAEREGGRRQDCRGQNHRFGMLSAVCAHTKNTIQNRFTVAKLRALNRPCRAGGQKMAKNFPPSVIGYSSP